MLRMLNTTTPSTACCYTNSGKTPTIDNADAWMYTRGRSPWWRHRTINLKVTGSAGNALRKTDRANKNETQTRVRERARLKSHGHVQAETDNNTVVSNTNGQTAQNREHDGCGGMVSTDVSVAKNTKK